jgi:hypothetical protein
MGFDHKYPYAFRGYAAKLTHREKAEELSGSLSNKAGKHEGEIQEMRLNHLRREARIPR